MRLPPNINAAHGVLATRGMECILTYTFLSLLSYIVTHQPWPAVWTVRWGRESVVEFCLLGGGQYGSYTHVSLSRAVKRASLSRRYSRSGGGGSGSLCSVCPLVLCQQLANSCFPYIPILLLSVYPIQPLQRPPPPVTDGTWGRASSKGGPGRRLVSLASETHHEASQGLRASRYTRGFYRGGESSTSFCHRANCPADKKAAPYSLPVGKCFSVHAWGPRGSSRVGNAESPDECIKIGSPAYASSSRQKPPGSSSRRSLSIACAPRTLKPFCTTSHFYSFYSYDLQQLMRQTGNHSVYTKKEKRENSIRSSECSFF